MHSAHSYKVLMGIQDTFVQFETKLFNCKCLPKMLQKQELARKESNIFASGTFFSASPEQNIYQKKLSSKCQKTFSSLIKCYLLHFILWVPKHDNHSFIAWFNDIHKSQYACINSIKSKMQKNTSRSVSQSM